jgi:CRP-like cAMP-binding protein
MNATSRTIEHPTRLAPVALASRTGPLPGPNPRPVLDGILAESAPAVSVWAELLGGLPLDEAEARALAELASVRRVAPAERLMCRTVKAEHLVALQRGEVALGLRTADGAFRVERIVRGPAWLDLSSAWLGGTHVMDAQALSDAVLVSWPQEALARRLPRLPGLALRVIRSLAGEAHALAINTHELMHKDAPARLAHWLHQRCELMPGHPGQAVVTLRDRKRDLASQLAITPETLSRLMRSFSGQGVIEVAGYNVRVLDVPALQRLAQDG